VVSVEKEEYMQQRTQSSGAIFGMIARMRDLPMGIGRLTGCRRAIWRETPNAVARAGRGTSCFVGYAASLEVRCRRKKSIEEYLRPGG
jgi:hypothetical protein